MTDLIQTAAIIVLAIACIVQGIAISNLSRASKYNSESIQILNGRNPHV